MRRSLAWYSAPVSFVHVPSWADFITITSGFRFSVHTGMQTKAIGLADDFEEADGKDILTWWQAVETVRQRGKPDGGVAPGSIAVQQAFDKYLPTLEGKNARSARTTKGRVNKHILSRLGQCRVVDLTKTQLEGWQSSLVKKSDDKEAVRKSKDSANRVLTC
jgi:hypothetical protein